MRKHAFCICENKGTDQLCGNRTADLRLCFCYINSTIPLLSKFLAIFSCTARFVLDLVGNTEDRFSHNAAHLSPGTRKDSHLSADEVGFFFSLIFETHSEKTGLRGFRPGPKQTRLYSDRRWLEA